MKSFVLSTCLQCFGIVTLLHRRCESHSYACARITVNWLIVLIFLCCHLPLAEIVSADHLRIGENIRLLIDRPDGTYCFRLHKDRVYYISEILMKRAANVEKDKLLSFGTCFGKFTKTGKFRLHVTALDYLAPYAKYKVWLKPNAEQQFLYGHHVMKSGVGRLTENTPQYQGVVVYSMGDLPLGFGVSAKSTTDSRHVDPMTIVMFHQADIGEYLRNEETLT